MKPAHRHSVVSNLAIMRAARSWSQAELARLSGLSRAEVSAIETGRVVPSVAAALALAAAFSCRVEEIFGIGGRHAEGVELAIGEPVDGMRVWYARVGQRVRAFPVEPTAMGTLAHDGVWGGETRESATVREVGPERTLVIAGCDPAVGLLAAEYARLGFRLLPLQRSSGEALELVREGKVHGAGVHFGGDGGADGASGNRPRVARALGGGFRLARVATWEDGLAVGGGVRGTSIASVVRGDGPWAVRERGSVARECLDAVLGARAGRIADDGRIAKSHRAVAEVIRSGWANAGVCVRLTAEEAGLRFLSIQREAYDLCFPVALMDDPRVLALMKVLQSRSYREAIGALPGYHAGDTGEVADVE